MKNKFNISMVLAALFVIVTRSLVQAAPTPLPSSFYGTVTLDDADIPAGALVSAWINGVQYAETPAFLEDGASVFIIDVPADDPDTPEIEGGQEGDTVLFQVDGHAAAQTALWSSGGYSRLDLTAIRTAPDLQIIKTTGVVTAAPGNLITYTLVYTNAGSRDATGVVITDTVPAHTSFDPAVSSSDWSCLPDVGANSTCTFSVNDLATNAGNTVTYTIRVDNLLPAGVEVLTNTAVMADDGANGADQNPADNEAIETTAVSAVPDLTISKTDGQETVRPGQWLTYTLTISNVGNQAATGVTVTDTLPLAGISFIAASDGGSQSDNLVTWPLFDLAANTSLTRSVTVQVDDPIPAGIDLLTNTVRVVDDGRNGSDPSPADNIGRDITRVLVPDLVITKDDGQTVALPGQWLTYTLTISNVGNQTATGVAVTDTLPLTGISFIAASDGGSRSDNLVTWPSFDLAAGASLIRSVTIRVDDLLPAGVEVLTNTAIIADDGTSGPDQNPADNQAIETTAVSAVPDLTVSKSDGQETVRPGQGLTYTLTISNVGNQTATGIAMTDTLPLAGISFIAASDGGSRSDNLVTWPLFDLAANTSLTRSVTVQVDDPIPAGIDLLTNTVRVVDDGRNGSDPSPADNIGRDITRVLVPDLVITKDDGQTVALPGQWLTYTLTISNVGNQTATGVAVTDTLPLTGISFIAASDGGSRSDNLVTWPSFDLAAGASLIRSVTIRVDDLLPAGVDVLTNTAIVADDGASGADPTQNNNIATDLDLALAVPDLTVTKEDGRTLVQAGDLLTYTLTISNVGMQDATGVNLTDTLPTLGVTYLGASDSGFRFDRNVVWPAFDLLAGTSLTRTLTIQLDDPLPAEIVDVTNLVTVSDDGQNGADPTPANNNDDDIDAVLTIPDLTILDVDRSSSTADAQALTITGDISAQLRNQGYQDVTQPFQVTIFEDRNQNGLYNPLVDNVLGERTYPDVLGGRQTVWFSIPVSGTVLFRDNLLYAFVDSDETIVESVEENNYANSGQACEVQPTPGTFAPQLEWAWIDTDGPTIQGSMMTPVVSPLIDTNEDDQVDEADIPAIIFIADQNRLVAIRGDGGGEIFQITDSLYRVGAGENFSQIAVGDIDGDQLPEIITVPTGGNRLIAFENDGSFKWFSAPGTSVNYGGPALADLDRDGIPEIIAGATVYNADGTIRWRRFGARGQNVGFVCCLSVVADIDLDGIPEIVAGPTVYRANGDVFWSNPGDGWPAIANFDDDPFPEIAVISNGAIRLYEHDGALKWGPVSIPGGGGGGPLTIADFDSDGAPEIGVAALRTYSVLETDGSIKWSSSTRDASSNITGSSVFDFDGDGNAEVVYNDELYLRVYRGHDGAVLFEIPNSSGTLIENPVIADVDRDGNAEIVVVSNNYNGYGTEVGLTEFGVSVYGDALDNWVSTRGIWNQHTYHVTNVNDDGTIPAHEVDSWDAHNTYRANVQPTGSVFVAPDLTASRLSVDVADFPTSATFTARIGNGGASLVGPGIPVSFYQGDPASGGTPIGTVQTTKSLDPGEFEEVTLVWNSPAPGSFDLYVVADDDGVGIGTQNECNETNNIHWQSYTAGFDLELRKEDGRTTLLPGEIVTYTLTVNNIGGNDATGVVLTDTLPTSGVNFVAATDGGSEVAGEVFWPVFDLIAGASVTRTITLQVNDLLPAGVEAITNSAVITDDGTSGPDLQPENNSASDTDIVIATPNLAITKENGQDAVGPGDLLTYTLTISNVGTQDATGVLVTDTLPIQGISFIAASNGGSEAAGEVTWPAFDLAARTSVTRTVTVEVDKQLPAGLDTITNTAQVTDDGTNGADPTPADNTATDSDLVLAAPDLTVAKRNGQTTVRPGEILTYTLTISNVGNQDASGVMLTDTLPISSVSFVSASNGGAETGGRVTWFAFDLPALTSVTRTVTVQVDNLLPAGLISITNTALVTDNGTNGPDPTPINNSASDTDMVIAAPDLVLSKDDGQSTVQPGDTVTYTLTISNSGSQAATGVLLTDTLPTQGVTFINASSGGSESGGLVTWPSFSLAGGASAIRTVTVRINDPIPSGLNSLTNSASVTDDGSNGPEPTPTNNSASDTDVVFAAPDLVISKDNGQSTVQPGDTVTYTLRIDNAGSQAATGVLLTDTLPTQGITFISASNGGSENSGLVTWPSFSLAGGASATRTITVRIDDPLPAGLSTLTNSASVSDDGSNGSDPTPTNNSASDTDSVIATPDLVLSKDDGQSTVQPGNAVTYTLRIDNVGSQAASGVLLTDTLPTQGVSFVSASSGSSGNAGLVTWPAFSLAGGASATRTVTVRVDDPLPAGLNSITNSASVSDDRANGPDPTPANNSASDTDSIVAAPDLVLSKDDGQSTVLPGDTVTYTLRIDNAGSQAATGVLLTDTLPTQSNTFISASNGGSESAGLVSWPSFSLAGGASATRTVTVRIDDPLLAGLDSLTNAASVSDDGANGPDPTPANNSASDTDVLFAVPDLVLSKDNGQSTVEPGDTVTYALRIDNAGSQAATGVLLTDTLSTQGITVVSASSGGSASVGLVTWPAFSLAGGASATRTVTVRLDDPLPAGLSALTNTASVADDGTNGPDPTPANNSASDIDSVIAAPDLVLSKDDGQSTVQPGDTVIYTLRIDNVGSQAASGVLLTDTLPSQGVSFVSASSGGSENAGLVTWPAFTLSGGASAIRTVTVRIDDPVPSGLNLLTNLASVSDDGANGSDPTPANNSASDTDTVNIVTYPPVLAPISDQTLAEGTSLDVPLSASDADGDPISLTAAGLPGFASLLDNGDGSGLVSLAPGFTAAGVYPDVTISASDGRLTDTQRFTITVTEANRPPLADNQALSTPEDTPLPITLTGLDPDGDPLTFSLVSLPISGTLGGLAPSLVYTPSLDFNGQDRFTYQANDGLANSQVATVTITVTPVNDPPDAVDDLASATQGNPVTIDVLANDSDPDGDSLTVNSVGQPLSGTVILNPDDSLTYTPNAGFSGTDVFSYTIGDGQGAGDTALVSVQVAPGDALLPLCRLGAIRPGSPVEIELVLQDGQSGLSAINLLAEANAVATVPTFAAGTTNPVTVTVELDAIELVDVRVEAVDAAGNVSMPCELSGEVVNSSLGLSYNTAYNNSTLTFSLFPTWQHVSGGDILAPVGVKVTSLYGSGCPCTVSDDAGQSGGVGTMFKTPLVNDLADGMLSSGEQFRHDLRVQLSRRANFSFYVDIWGIRFSNSVGMSSSSLAASKSRASFKLEIEGEQLRDNGALYLPLIIKSP